VQGKSFYERLFSQSIRNLILKLVIITKNLQTMNGYSKSNPLPAYKRYCKVLKLQENKELIEKYKEIHKPENIWPVISRGIREVGIIDMEIYIKDNMAFMIMDTVPDFDHEKAMKKLAGLPKQKEWEEYVSQFQNAGAKADTPEKWEIVERMFVL
jgi:Domain of unknown function (DUF718).